MRRCVDDLGQGTCASGTGRGVGTAKQEAQLSLCNTQPAWDLVQPPGYSVRVHSTDSALGTNQTGFGADVGEPACNCNVNPMAM